jgi:hypothetical protein
LNPYMFVVAERLSNVPEVTTADKYLLGSMEHARNKGREIREPRGPYKCTVGGEEFFGLDSKRRLQGRMVDTSHLAAVKKAYFFTIFAAWEGDADGSVLKKSLDSVRFTKAARKPDAGLATKTSGDQSVFHWLRTATVPLRILPFAPELLNPSPCGM